MELQRNTTFDIAKGMAIFLIVLGHIRNSNTPIVLNNTISFINYFHVAVFFIISGYFSSPRRGWKEYIIKKAKRLVVPYLIANIILLGVELLIKLLITGRTSIPSASMLIRAFIGIDPVWLAIPTWFLMTLFFISLLHKAIFNTCGDSPSLSLVICILIAFTSWLVQDRTSIFGIVFIARTNISLAFFAMGHFAKEKMDLSKYSYGCKKSIIGLIVSVAILAILFFVTRYRVNYYWQKGYNLFLTILSGTSGSAMILFTSSLIDKKAERLKKHIINLGQGSMYILIGHYPVFLVISAVQCLLCKIPFSSLTRDVCLDPGHCWWAVYLILGVSVPLSFKRLAEVRETNSLIK